MKLRTIFSSLAGAGLLAMSALAPAAAADTGSLKDHVTSSHLHADQPSWAQFQKETYRDADGQYIVHGDIPVPDTPSLQHYYNAVHQPGKLLDPKLAVNLTAYGDPTIWSPRQAQNLTYCVSDQFGYDKWDVVDAMNRAASMWERASSSINFRYISSEDGNCTTRNNNVLFSVEPTYTDQYIARAFFPDSAKWQRNILVTPQLMNSGWAPQNIMAHELGHVLGFRHEHTRPESGACYEDDNWYALTPYDSASIMHYPQCNGSSQDLSFSHYDVQGVRSVYGR